MAATTWNSTTHPAFFVHGERTHSCTPRSPPPTHSTYPAQTPPPTLLLGPTQPLDLVPAESTAPSPPPPRPPPFG